MKDEKGGGKQRKRRAQKHRKSSSGSRKGKTTRSLTLAEKSGLEERDIVVRADVGRSTAPRPLLDLLELQFRLWSAALRLSPLAHILRQQAEMTRRLFDVWLRESGTQEKRGSRRKRDG
jgi:hypothetical protein